MKANLFVVAVLFFGLSSAIRISHHNEPDAQQENKVEELEYDPHALTDGVMPPGESDEIKALVVNNVKAKLSAKQIVAQENKHLE